MVLTLIASLILPTATGGSETLFPASDRRATVVYTVLAECPNARAYSAEMARIARDYRAKGVRSVMTFVDGEPKAWRAQMKAFGLHFPAARATSALRKLLRPEAAPTAAIVSADGTVAYVGRIDDRFPALGVRREPRTHDLRRALDLFLAGKRVVPSRTTVVGCLLPNG